MFRGWLYAGKLFIGRLFGRRSQEAEVPVYDEVYGSLRFLGYTSSLSRVDAYSGDLDHLSPLGKMVMENDYAGVLAPR